MAGRARAWRALGVIMRSVDFISGGPVVGTEGGPKRWTVCSWSRRSLGNIAGTCGMWQGEDSPRAVEMRPQSQRRTSLSDRTAWEKCLEASESHDDRRGKLSFAAVAQQYQRPQLCHRGDLSQSPDLSPVLSAIGVLAREVCCCQKLKSSDYLPSERMRSTYDFRDTHPWTPDWEP